MTDRRILLGPFDLLHIGHVGQIRSMQGISVSLMVGILSDEAVRQLCGAEPFAPATERAAVVERVRGVARVFVTGPEDGWSLPVHDSLFVDESIAQPFRSAFGDLEPVISLPVTSVPAHPAVATALSARARVA